MQQLPLREHASGTPLQASTSLAQTALGDPLALLSLREGASWAQLHAARSQLPLDPEALA